jgi:hypothetical protein
MRGNDQKQDAMFSYVSPEQRVPTEHPLRALRAMMDDILKEMSPRFAKLYADTGRPSIPPERLLRALLLQILYTVRSERLLMPATMKGDPRDETADIARHIVRQVPNGRTEILQAGRAIPS